MSLEPRCRHGNIRSAEPCRDCDERDALRARVAELEAILRRVDVYFQHTGKVGDLPVSVHALLPIAQPNPQNGMK